MKSDIHPKYNQITVTCACGNTFQTGSTLESIQVEICSACHPFFTGEMKFVDTMGRVEKFQAKRTKAAKNDASKKKSSSTKSSQEPQKTLKEMLEDTKIKTTSK